MRPFTSAAIAEAGQAVKPGAGQERAGCFQAGQPGSDAPRHHRPPGNPAAGQRGAGAPRTPPDLREHSRHASFSRGCDSSLEKHASEVCGTVHLYRLEDGRLLVRRVDCKTKACPKCGPRLRAEYAAGYAAVMAPCRVYRQVVGPGWRKRPGAEYLRIPAPGGQLVVYTTAEQGQSIDEPVIASALASDFAAMPSDRRNVSASKAWRGAYHAWRDLAAGAAKAPAEHLGQLRRPLEQVAIVAAELDMLIDQRPDALLLRDPPDAATWERFCALAGLYRRRGEAIAA
jgi:hypothetical protein